MEMTRASLARFETAFHSVSKPGSTREGKDASNLYGQNQYEFYITDKNAKYELAIFDMKCNDEYPIELTIDQSIAEEAELDTECEIETGDEFKRYFAEMLKTHKVIYVIKKLIQIAKEADPDKESE